MKIFATALVGFSLMLGTVMAQTPAASTSTDTTATKVKKHNKKHTAKSTTPAPSTDSTPAK